MKAYLVFLEGSNTPKRLHIHKNTAEKEAKRLAEQHPDKEVMTLLVINRVKFSCGTHYNLGSHIPDPPYLTTDNLIQGKDAKHQPPNKKTLTLKLKPKG